MGRLFAMTKRQIVARAMDGEHKRLMLACHRARGGEKLKAQAKLLAYVTARLKDCR
jgi:hypothetical protein